MREPIATPPPMLRIRQSNRLDALADDLIASLDGARDAHPLAQDAVVVQSPGMATWLRHRLAERAGIAAAVDFPLPSTLIWRVIRALVPEAQTTSPYGKADMAWRLLALLDPADPDFARDPANAPLLRYLADDDAGLKRWQLAQRVADLFDQYLVYRPDWMRHWRGGEDDAPAGGDERWQPRLWRRLVAATGDAADRAELQARATARLEAEADLSAELGDALPATLSVFGISALPPEQLRLLLALGRHREVGVHVFNPCRQYWADLVSEPWLARRVAEETAEGATATHPYYETGHPLLAALGRAGRDFVDLLLELGEDAEIEDAFVEPDATTTLGRLQADLLDLEDADATVPVPDDDESLVFADCHGPLRELEALHDWLLARFEADPSLTPRDVVVMIPDIDRYAPCIEAVFGSGADPALSVPFAIADRGGRSEAPVLGAVAGLLRLPRSRRTVAELLGILETPAVLRAFGLDEGDLEQIGHWLEAAGVRWGRDAAHWRRFGAEVPEDEGPLPNTWRAGVERLLLGYAMGDAGTVWRGMVPLPGVEGSAAEAVGGLLAFLDAVDRFADDLGRPQSPARWSRLLDRLLATFLDPDADESQALDGLRALIADLARVEAGLGVGEALSPDVIGAAVEPVLEQPAGAHRFLAGGVTFCTLMPMRTVPFRVVAVLGMNDGDYPRQDTPLGFDLLPRFPRKGDRARRLEDRYLFLEAILAAREHLYVSWSGHSPTDDAVQPPSVVVAELRDALARRCVRTDGTPLPQGCTTAHRLQPFSPAYGPGGLTTYSTLWARGEHAAPDAGTADADLGPPPAVDPLPLESLVRTFLDPSGAFLAERLDVRLDAARAGADEDEPFELAGLERWRVRAAAFEALRAGEDVDAWMTRERRRGLLPHGAAGEDALAEARDLLLDYRMRFGDLLTAPADARLVVVPLDGVGGDGVGGAGVGGDRLRLEGALDGLLPGARRVLRIGPVRPRDRLRAWIEHQALCAGGLGRPTLIADDAVLWCIDPVDPAAAVDALARLVELRAVLLRRPEPLFVETSFAWAERAGKGPDAARSAARKAWAPSWRPGAGSVPGEGDAPAVARLWPAPPVDDPAYASRFAELAETVWAPVIAAVRRVEDDAERTGLVTAALTGIVSGKGAPHG